MSVANTYEPAALASRQYRDEPYTTSLLLRDLRIRKGAAIPGNSFSAVELVTTDGDGPVKQDVSGNKRFLLVFGSLTWNSAGPFRRIILNL